VLKIDVVEDEKAVEANKKVRKVATKALRKKKAKEVQASDLSGEG